MVQIKLFFCLRQRVASYSQPSSPLAVRSSDAFPLFSDKKGSNEKTEKMLIECLILDIYG